MERIYNLNKGISTIVDNNVFSVISETMVKFGGTEIYVDNNAIIFLIYPEERVELRVQLKYVKTYNINGITMLVIKNSKYIDVIKGIDLYGTKYLISTEFRKKRFWLRSRELLHIPIKGSKLSLMGLKFTNNIKNKYYKFMECTKVFIKENLLKLYMLIDG